MTNEGLRQRLIELLSTADGGIKADIADYLIANGVTIRERGECICKLSTFPQYEPDQYCCSNCGCIKNFYYNFCPNCGADMRGENDE